MVIDKIKIGQRLKVLTHSYASYKNGPPVIPEITKITEVIWNDGEEVCVKVEIDPAYPNGSLCVIINLDDPLTPAGYGRCTVEFV